MSALDGEPARANDLGVALRTWRRRADPAASGLPVDRSRRVAGLRREELARLAGMSVDYVVRLEQGRASSPSAQILTAMARALRLSADERRHLFLLAGRLEPAPDRPPVRLTPGVRRLLDRMEGSPVGVFDAAWTLIAWNRLYALLTGDCGNDGDGDDDDGGDGGGDGGDNDNGGDGGDNDNGGGGERDRNLAWRHFTGMPSRVSHTPEQTERFEAATVADLRAATARRPGDDRLRVLIADLRRHSPRFAELWASHEVGAHVMDSKTMHHPDVGELHLDCDVLTVPGSDVHVVVCTAEPGSEAAGKLRLLSVIGAPPVAEQSPVAGPRPCAAQ